MTDKYEPTVSVTTKTVNNNVEMSVKDSGNDIPRKVVDKIFTWGFKTVFLIHLQSIKQNEHGKY